jgi:hypothetical protein
MANPFDSITEDPLDQILNHIAEQGKPPKAPPASYKPHFEQPCDKCRGTGRFVGYTGKVFGQCFACKGSGKLMFKTSPADRAKAQASRERKSNEAAANTAREFDAWKLANAAEWAWILANPKFDFATSMVEALAKYGSLTDGQMAAIRKCIARNGERKQAAVNREASAPTIDITKIEAAFSKAKASKLQYPKLLLDTFKFQPAGPASKWAGSIYVTDATEMGQDGRGLYLGRITDGKLVVTRGCGEERQARILAAAASPAEAAIKYGHMSGSCSCCGRRLDNPESVARGIGPICYAKYF